MKKTYKVKAGYLEPILRTEVKMPGSALLIQFFGLFYAIIGVAIGIAVLIVNSMRFGIIIFLATLLLGAMLYGFGKIIELLYYENEKLYKFKDVVLEEITSDDTLSK